MWCTRSLTVPSGTVALCFAAVGDDLNWWRAPKTFATDWSFQSSGVEPSPSACPSVSWGGHRWWQASSWVDAVTPPNVARWMLEPDCCTGRVTTVLEFEEGRGCDAVLLLAKSDTRFRRLGLWGLRLDILTALPRAFASMLGNGRCGTIVGQSRGGRQS